MCLLAHSCEAQLLLSFMAKSPQSPRAQKLHVWHGVACLPLSRDRGLRGIRGSGAAASGQRPYPDSWIQLNSKFTICPNSPWGWNLLCLRDKLFCIPLYLTYTEPFSFISSPSCIIPATSYSLEIALFNIFLHFDCYAIF